MKDVTEEIAIEQIIDNSVTVMNSVVDSCDTPCESNLDVESVTETMVNLVVQEMSESTTPVVDSQEVITIQNNENANVQLWES